MSNILIIAIVLVLIILGGVAYWKRADLFGTGDDDAEAAKAAAEKAAAAAKAVLGDPCSTEKMCESPLVCSDLICANPPVDCDFKWGEWSSCSATACGTDGTQVRSYTINKNGAYGGVACEYNDGYEEEKPCSMPNCTTGSGNGVGGAGEAGVVIYDCQGFYKSQTEYCAEQYEKYPNMCDAINGEIPFTITRDEQAGVGSDGKPPPVGTKFGICPDRGQFKSTTCPSNPNCHGAGSGVVLGGGAAAVVLDGGAGAVGESLAILGESCSTEKQCVSPLVCDEYSMMCAHAPVAVTRDDAYTPYEYGDLMYRNDAQDVNGYTLGTSNQVVTLNDLSGNDTHLSRHVLGKAVISSTLNNSTREYDMVNTPMTLENTINGHPCFDGFMIQGKENTWGAEAGNVRKTNTSGSYTVITVVYIDTNNTMWDSMLTFGAVLQSVGLYWTFDGRFSGCINGQLMGNAGVPDYVSTMKDKPLLIVYRVLENTTMKLQMWDINNPGIILFDGTATIDPTFNTAPTFKNATHAPLFIGCNHNIRRANPLWSMSDHHHGETIMYNRYLNNTEITDTKEFLVNKWSPR
jgi:hypothetical protein